MRVLLATFDPPSGSGGIEGRTTAYTRNLMQRGIHVEVAAFAPNEGGSTESYLGTRLTRLSSSFRRFPRTFSALVEMTRSSSLDAVFFLSGGSTPIGILTLWFARLTGRRSGVFFYGRDVLQYRQRFIGRFLLAVSILLSHRVATNSRYTANLLPLRPRRQVLVIYPGIDPDLVDAARGAREEVGPPRILFVGRLVRRKGADLLLTAFERLRHDSPDARLDIVGDGPEMKDLLTLSEGLHLNGAVTFHGALYGTSLWSRYAEACIFAMPARESTEDVEGFGTVFLEAGAFGVPSIATRTGGIPEAVIDGVTGRLVENEDLEGLTNTIGLLLQDRVERQRLGTNARTWASNFTWAASTDQVIRLMGENDG